MRMLISLFASLLVLGSYQSLAVELGMDGDLVSGLPTCPTDRDLTQDAVWDREHVCAMTVESYRTENNDVELTLKATHKFSGLDCPTELTCHGSMLCFDPFDYDRSVECGDTLLLIFRKGNLQPYIAALKIPQPPEDSSLVRRLTKISELRESKGGLMPLSEGVFDDDPVVASYCLKRMMTRYPPDAHGYIERLRRLRDTPADVKDAQELCNTGTTGRHHQEIILKTKARILAAQLMLVLQGSWPKLRFTDDKYSQASGRDHLLHDAERTPQPENSSGDPKAPHRRWLRRDRAGNQSTSENASADGRHDESGRQG